MTTPPSTLAPGTQVFVRADGRSTPLADTDIVLGRSPYCTIQLDHRSVSRVHATVRLRDGQIEIEDMGSANGTFVNGDRIAAPRIVRSEDTILVGAVPVTLVVVAAAPLAATDVPGSDRGGPQ